jgi:transketolase
MGQGLSVAQGFALAGHTSPKFDSYALTGDGELQEGTIWEAVMFAATKHLDNFCVLVDQNNGQLDIASRTVFPMPRLEDVFAAFGWRVLSADATQYEGVYAALEEFRYGPRNGKPTAIICHGQKGFGACSDFMNKHKVVIPDSLMEQELDMQRLQREARVEDYERLRERLESGSRAQLDSVSKRFLHSGTKLKSRVPARNKAIRYDSAALPKIDPKKEYASSDMVTAAMKVFARDRRIISIDADLATTSGLEAGVAAVDQKRALNVGVAEANMMSMGEAFAALGYNTWVSTFCPFFNWQVLRRISVGHQERLEAMEAPNGWLSEGHGLDLTFLATGPDFETRTNGATHMGNDDITIFDGSAHLNIINVSCPRQLLAVMKWIMEGNRGLVYMRVMRTASAVLYDERFRFEFGKAYTLRETPEDAAVIVTSGRAVHEALAAAEQCANAGVGVSVVDMPSIDEQMLTDLSESGKLVVFAEQNNGFLWQNFARIATRKGAASARVITVNTLTGEGKPQFIHSGLYEELLEVFGLSPRKLAATVIEGLAI